MVATFVRIHGGRLAQFSVQGVGKVYVTTASFANKEVPQSLDVPDTWPLREASESAQAAPGDEEKAAKAAAKAQEKAAKAEAKAQAAREKAEARVKKAQEAAAKAAERAAKITAQAKGEPAAEGGDQPEL